MFEESLDKVAFMVEHTEISFEHWLLMHPRGFPWAALRLSSDSWSAALFLLECEVKALQIEAGGFRLPEQRKQESARTLQNKTSAHKDFSELKLCWSIFFVV